MDVELFHRNKTSQNMNMGEKDSVETYDMSMDSILSDIISARAQIEMPHAMESEERVSA